MPASVVKTGRDERMWKKAKKDAGFKGEREGKYGYGLVMNIYKRMKEKYAGKKLPKKYTEGMNEFERGMLSCSVDPFSSQNPLREGQSTDFAEPSLWVQNSPWVDIWHDESAITSAWVKELQNAGVRAREDDSHAYEDMKMVVINRDDVKSASDVMKAIATTTGNEDAQYVADQLFRADSFD